MTPIHHPLWFPLRESPGSFPHSLPIASAREKGFTHRSTHRFPKLAIPTWGQRLFELLSLGTLDGHGSYPRTPSVTSDSIPTKID